MKMKPTMIIALAMLSANCLRAGEIFEDWQFNDANDTQLNSVANTGSVATAWSFGGPKTQNGTLNIGDTTYFKYNVGTGQTFRAADFADITTGKVVFEFVIADWDLSGSTGETGNGIIFKVGDKDDGLINLEFEVAQAPGDDIRVRSGGSNNGSLTGTDVQNQLGNGLDLINTASVTVQLIADLDTGLWSTQVDAGSDGSFVDLVTDGTGMNSIDRIQLVLDGGANGWAYVGTGGETADFVKIDSVTLARPIKLAVDFDVSQITANSQHDSNDFPLNLAGPPEAGLPGYTGQPIYAGLDLEPVNGLDTGDDDGLGGTYTNGAGVSFGTNGGVKLQWNGPFSNPPVADADLGRYEAGDVATGVFLIKKSSFLNGLDAGHTFMNAANDTLSATIRLDTKENDPNYPLQRLNSGKFRWVVQDAGSFYISDEVIDMLSDAGEILLTNDALDLTWFDYDPETSITTVSATASPTFQNIEALGFWMSTTIAANDGWRRYHNMQCTSFTAEATGTAPLLITGTSYAGPGNDFIINFTGNPGTTYKVAESADLQAPFTLIDGVTSTTDGSGVGTATVPSASTGTVRHFFRMIE